MIYFLLFFVFSFVTYGLVSLFGQLTGDGSGSLFQAITKSLQPIPLLIIIVSNIFFAAGLYFGFKFTQFAIPSAIAIGVIAAFFYSAFFLGGTVTWFKMLGVVLILLGIYFLK